MSDHVNYYDILEIPKNSSSEEIKKGYSKLAKKWHPDRNPDNVEEATQKFKDISVAYGVLSNPEKKEIYDKHGYEGLQQSSDGGSTDPMEMFHQMIGQMGSLGGLGGMMGQMGQMFGMQQEDENGGVSDVQVPLKLSLKDAYNGKTTHVNIERVVLCEKCNGTGAKDKSSDITCKPCKGNGQVMVQIRNGPFMQIAQTACKNCKGTGISADVEKCKKCDGNKGIKETAKVEVTVPKGVYEKVPITIQGEGHAIPKDSVKGTRTKTDLIVVVLDAISDNTFKRNVVIPGKKGVDPSDLMINVDLSFAESVSGFYKEIPHLDNHMIKLSMTDPCRHGDTYVIRGEGMPKFNKLNQFGDLIIQFNVEHPKHALSDEKLRSKLVDSLGGKHSKLPKKVVPHEMITIEQYQNDIKIKARSEQMRNQFKKGHQQQCDNCDDDNCDNCDDDSDSDDSRGGQGGHGGPPQCQQM